MFTTSFVAAVRTHGRGPRMSPNSSEPEENEDDDVTVPAGNQKDISLKGKDVRWKWTTTLRVDQGQVDISAKGPLITPTGCGNRCKVRVWTDPSGTGTFTEVSDPELTAAGMSPNDVNYSQTLTTGGRIRYEGGVDVILTSAGGTGKVHRHKTTVQPPFTP